MGREFHTPLRVLNTASANWRRPPDKRSSRCATCSRCRCKRYVTNINQQSVWIQSQGTIMATWVVGKQRKSFQNKQLRDNARLEVLHSSEIGRLHIRQDQILDVIATKQFDHIAATHRDVLHSCCAHARCSTNRSAWKCRRSRSNSRWWHAGTVHERHDHSRECDKNGNHRSKESRLIRQRIRSDRTTKFNLQNATVAQSKMAWRSLVK